MFGLNVLKLNTILFSIFLLLKVRMEYKIQAPHKFKQQTSQPNNLSLSVHLSIINYQLSTIIESYKRPRLHYLFHQLIWHHHLPLIFYKNRKVWVTPF